jgi:hypothetical protein
MLGESSVSFSLLITAGAGGVIIYLNGGRGSLLTFYCGFFPGGW